MAAAESQFRLHRLANQWERRLAAEEKASKSGGWAKAKLSGKFEDADVCLHLTSWLIVHANRC